jgi:hypothetical protein
MQVAAGARRFNGPRRRFAFLLLKEPEQMSALPAGSSHQHAVLPVSARHDIMDAPAGRH